MSMGLLSIVGIIVAVLGCGSVLALVGVGVYLLMENRRNRDNE